jgi:DNA mismatch repair protein MutL
MNKINILSDRTINRIAAGEVIDRPVSVVKELVENAIDAKARQIIVKFERGGHNLISVSDDGCGINSAELALAVKRHATSKLQEEDINNITFYGFRGEALPSIGSVAKMRIISRTSAEENAFSLTVNGGEIGPITPAPRHIGTTVEVSDIFSYTPVRLKFLRSESSEKTAAIELIQRFALANPQIEFKFISDDKEVLNYKACEKVEDRLKEVLGKDFYEQSLPLNIAADDCSIFGYVGRPTYNFANSARQYTFVNQRIVKDKVLLHAIKAAYQNLIPDGRYPVLVLFLNLNPYEVDVNVHPSKVEVRFRDEQKIRSLIIGSLRETLRQPLSVQTQNVAPAITWPSYQRREKSVESFHENITRNFITPTQPIYNQVITKDEVIYNQPIQPAIIAEHPLGEAKCQVANLYIIAENKEGIVIVDQHAAHERITLENLKKQLADGKIKTQVLLVPEVVDLDQVRVDKLLCHQQALKNLGLNIERNGLTQIIISEVPVDFNHLSLKNLISDLADYIYEHNHTDIMQDKIDEILGNFACHYSIRSGRQLSLQEMNNLLRDIENTPNAGQCNHGRPTYIKFSKAKISQLFERS